MRSVIARARLRMRDVVRSRPPRWEAVRDDLAFRYLSGGGIESARSTTRSACAPAPACATSTTATATS